MSEKTVIDSLPEFTLTEIEQKALSTFIHNRDAEKICDFIQHHATMHGYRCAIAVVQHDRDELVKATNYNYQNK